MRSRIDAQPGNVAAEHALAIYAKALEAVRADTLILSALQRSGDELACGDVRLDLRSFAKIYVVGAGKAATGMAQAVEERLGDRLTAGVVVTKDGHGGPRRVIQVLEAAHPVPDARSVAAGKAIYRMVEAARESDLVICLISGGASALMELPVEGVSLEDLQATTNALLRAGADITDLNTVRSCLSKLKAGGLVRAAAPAQVLCLVLSDVLGNPLNVIGSGPCVDYLADPNAAITVLSHHGLLNSIPTSVRDVLSTDSQNRKSKIENRKSPVDHVIVGDIWTALNAAREAATARGLKPLVLTGWVQGEAREAGKVFGGIAHDLSRTEKDTGNDCIIAGGETIVTVRGNGKGGRSQELAAAASKFISGIEDVALLAAGTDGTDGPTDSAGGLVDGSTYTKAVARGISLEQTFAENNAYAYLSAAGGQIITGPTFSNVGDLIIAVSR